MQRYVGSMRALRSSSVYTNMHISVNCGDGLYAGSVLWAYRRCILLSSGRVESCSLSLYYRSLLLYLLHPPSISVRAVYPAWRFCAIGSTLFYPLYPALPLYQPLHARAGHLRHYHSRCQLAHTCILRLTSTHPACVPPWGAPKAGGAATAGGAAADWPDAIYLSDLNSGIGVVRSRRGGGRQVLRCVAHCRRSRRAARPSC
jgi:hypothetical protein